MTVFNVIYEAASDGSWSAYAADLPVYAAAATREEAEREIRAAISVYLDELAGAGEVVSTARSVVGTVTV
jgi:predicted RNase H-like HicB family nuclease